MNRPLPSLPLRDAWAVRSLAAGAVSSTLDLVVLILLVEGAHWHPVLATAVAVAIGGAVNFVLNKYLAFRDRDPAVGKQVARFAAGVGFSLLLHAALVATLMRRFGLHYLVAKLSADLLIFSLGNLALNRYVVFPERQHLVQRTGQALACLALVSVLVGAPMLSFHHGSGATLDAGGQAQRQLGSTGLVRSNAAEHLQLTAQPMVLGEASHLALAATTDDCWRMPAAPLIERRRRPPKA